MRGRERLEVLFGVIYMQIAHPCNEEIFKYGTFEYHTKTKVRCIYDDQCLAYVELTMYFAIGNMKNCI